MDKLTPYMRTFGEVAEDLAKIPWEANLRAPNVGKRKSTISRKERRRRTRARKQKRKGRK